MSIEFLLEVFERNQDREAVVWRDRPVRYGELRERVAHWNARLAEEGVPAGAVVVLEGDYSPSSVALLLACALRRCVVVPLTEAAVDARDALAELSQAEYRIAVDPDDEVRLEHLGRTARHPLYALLRERGNAGLLVFSSASTGQCKASLHDLARVLEKFRVPRHSIRVLAFLLFDHMGGLNTLFYTLSNAGCLVTVAERSPEAVLSAVAKHRVELLPTSPTFLNLILLSEAHARHDLSSLRTVSYGSEPAPESTLRRFHELFPGLVLQQTYGLTEVGVLRSKSRSSDSLWVKVGGEGFETRVVDGLLHVRARSAMVGYLNAPSPFTEDGWLNTGDAVETDGEYVRFLGRRSDVINVGGRKVYPSEVESVLQQVEDVAEATVYGAPNAISGSMVCARVRARRPVDERELARRIRAFCRGRLAPFQVPARIEVTAEPQHGTRFKKVRAAPAGP